MSKVWKGFLSRFEKLQKRKELEEEKTCETEYV